LQIVLLSLLAVYIYQKIIVSVLQLYYYKRQGVTFLPGIPILSDMLILLKCARKTPHETPFIQKVYDHFQKDAQGAYPPMLGIALPGFSMLIVNSVESLEEIYVKQNKYHSKAPFQRLMTQVLLGESILY